MTKKLKTDVIIVGGGLAGLTLAGVLGRAGVDVVSIDREAPLTQASALYDGRTTAISFASHRVLQAAGVWAGIADDCEPILDIKVAEGISPLFLHFSSEDDGKGNPFGWIIENRLLRLALLANLKKMKNVRHMAPAVISAFTGDDMSAGVILDDGTEISAPLLVGADGRHSSVRAHHGIGVRAWNYGQKAVVCNVSHVRSHKGMALEHFRAAGPFAVLPMTDDDGAHRSSVVWTVAEDEAAELLALSPEEFDARLSALFDGYLGRVRHVSKPMAYPLSLMHAKKYTAPRTVLMAEAAHVIHPIAGQGLNLSMRDIAVLSELVVDRLRVGLDIGSPALLAAYEDWRRVDVMMMAGFTDMLNKLFSNDLKSIGIIRALGVGIIEKISPLKGFFAGQAMGLGGKKPRIVQKGHL